tara:strand:- start:1252 stop:2103 length:852 start_codon:yes stop_codon:yes gene_type:complete
MGQYKYKLNEVPSVEKDEKFKIGDTKISRGVKYTVSGIDKETGGIKWDIDYLPNLTELFDTVSELVTVSKGVYLKAKDDTKFREIYEEARNLKNKIRTHIRNEYPEDFRRITMNVDEISTTGGGEGAASFTPGTGGQYATPFAFRKKGQKADDKAYKEIGYKSVKENVGSTLGPGPKAGPDGVKDNYYVKAFKYKLVPKKIKGAGTIVKQLFEDDSKKNFQLKRIEAFKGVEEKLNDIYTMISNAKNETIKYYKNNPDSFKVVKPTDLIMDYLTDIEKLLKGK